MMKCIALAICQQVWIYFRILEKIFSIELCMYICLIIYRSRAYCTENLWGKMLLMLIEILE